VSGQVVKDLKTSSLGWALHEVGSPPKSQYTIMPESKQDFVTAVETEI
jgi:hypothetical protein